ncbi:MAG TPA: hypothetical protein VN032_08050 [Thermoanaerobaculia bacterium]|jgi:hypothetical protein|nr:hypothetical protein [Thermoanaerobaculia bacterium]
MITARNPGRLALLLLRLFSILVAASALLCGMVVLRRERTALAEPARTAFHPLFRAQLDEVRGRLPAGAELLHLSASPEYWYSRLWQRALYPDNETILMQPPLSLDRVHALRAKYRARFAISAGDPPFDPGFLWKIDLGPLALGPGQNWFGELAP